MANVYAYKRLNKQVRIIKREISEDLIQLLSENDVQEGQITVSEDTITLRIKNSNVKTTLFRNVDKYIGSAGEVSADGNDLLLTYEL